MEEDRAYDVIAGRRGDSHLPLDDPSGLSEGERDSVRYFLPEGIRVHPA